MNSKFGDEIFGVISQVPKGRVVSYGQVAVYAGKPRGARAVGWWLRTSNRADKVPWWRVVNSQGRLSIKANMWHDREEQKWRLEEEDVEVGQEYNIDMAKYQWFRERE